MVACNGTRLDMRSAPPGKVLGRHRPLVRYGACDGAWMVHVQVLYGGMVRG